MFVAGGTGVLGQRLVTQLVARGHRVTATTTSAARLGLAQRLGAVGVVMDGLDAASVGAAVAEAQPDATVHQITAISVAHAGKPDMRPVNGQPGAVLRDRDGRVLNTLALDILDGRIQAIRSVVNPDKLHHLGPVADAWAINREANEARRLPG